MVFDVGGVGNALFGRGRRHGTRGVLGGGGNGQPERGGQRHGGKYDRIGHFH